MVAPTRPPANAFVAAMRKVYNPIGFGKGYNFVLWFVFCGALFGFCLARFMYLDFNGVYCSLDASGGNGAAPGECYTYSKHTFYLIGIKLHLYCIIPGAFLACFQFVPWIRLNHILIHRINGYLVLLLSTVATAGALMVARMSFGGAVETQTVTGLLAIMFFFSLVIALYNIKTLQLEQHRAWMLRAWFYAGCIITARLIMVLAAMIISSESFGPYYLPMSCGKLANIYDNSTALLEAQPACSDLNAWVLVAADMNGDGATVSAALSLNFGSAVWLALAIHAIGIEFYLHLTPAESERLRRISYQRQMEAGFKNPGRGGLTADRLGDATLWSPAMEDKVTTYRATSESST